MKSIKSKNNFVCSCCDKAYNRASELKKHESSHYKVYECKYCSKRFNFLSSRIRHEKQHQRYELVQCEECHRKFYDDILLKRHKKYAHKGTFMCTVCKSSFGSKLALSNHTKIHVSEDEWKYRCSYKGCTKAFKFPHHLKNHVMTHTNTKHHYCDICRKGFIQKHHYKSHMATHNPEQWLTCSITSCKKKYPTSYSLKRHLVTHEIITDKKFSSNLRSETHNLVELSEVATSNTSIKPEVSIKDAGGLISSQNTIFTDIKDIETKENNIANDFTSSCKDILDGCLISGSSEIADNCLCAQITQCSDNQNKNDDHALVQNQDDIKMENKTDSYINVKKQSTKDLSNQHQLNKNEPGKINCHPMSHPICNNENNKSVNAPLIEYRIDGSIKLKELIDVDIRLQNCDNKNICDEKDKKMLDNYYSCKDIIGGCIVSGNSTTGEGCICAKMSAKQNDNYSQEIQEITPYLESSTYIV